MIQEISHNGKLMAIILRAGYSDEGIKFFTPDEFSQQLAYMKRPKNYIIEPHTHNSVKREKSVHPYYRRISCTPVIHNYLPK